MLRQLRLAAGLTQEALAERARLSVEAVSAIERGTRRFPRRYTLDQLATALQLTEAERGELKAVAGRRGPASSGTPATPDTRAAGHPAPAAVPRQLPPAIGDFVGRGRELALLQARLRHRPDPAATPVVTVVGMPGVGKTTLVLRLAHELHHAYPDGQLFLDLRGHLGPAETVPADDALAVLLRSLGARPSDIPDDRDTATGYFRTLVADRRILLVLDDAHDPAQVTALLPGTAGAAVLVTSRADLSGLPGSYQLLLAPFPAEHSELLLATVAGPGRVAAEPEAARRVVERCGHLPLAVRLAAARLSARPGWSVTQLDHRLADAQHRLGQLRSGNTTVRSSFAVAVDALAGSPDPIDRRAGHAFGMLGLPDAPELTTGAAAALLDLPPPETEPVLERLTDLHLLEERAPGRFRMHDLLRVFAREYAQSNVPADDRAAALTRWISRLTAAAWRCLARTHPGSHRLALADPDLPAGPDLADTAAALAWLDAESEQLLPAARQAATDPTIPGGLLIQLAHALFGYHVVRNPGTAWLETGRLAVDAASAAGRRADEAALRHDLAVGYAENRRYQDSLEQLDRALRQYQELGDAVGQARALSSASRVHQILGRWRESAALGERSLAINTDLGDLPTQAVCSLSLGLAYAHLGDHHRELEHYRRSLGIYAQLGDERGRAVALVNIGRAHYTAGRYGAAIDNLTTAYRTLRSLGDHDSATIALAELGVTYAKRGEPQTGVAHLEDSVALAVAHGLTLREARCRQQLGEVLAALGHVPEARTHWHTALATYRHHGDHARAAEVHRLLAAPPPTPPGRS